MTTEEKHDVIFETLAEKIEEQRRAIDDLYKRLDSMCQQHRGELNELTAKLKERDNALRHAHNTIEQISDERDRLVFKVNQYEEQKGEDNAE